MTFLRAHRTEARVFTESIFPVVDDSFSDFALCLHISGRSCGSEPVPRAKVSSAGGSSARLPVMLVHTGDDAPPPMGR